MQLDKTVGTRRLGVLGLLLLAACTSWRPFVLDTAGAPAARLPYAIRVTRADGSRLAVLAPFVRHDSLFGRRGRDTLAIAFGDISYLERERFSALRTGAVLLAIPTAFILVYVIECGGGQCTPQYGL